MPIPYVIKTANGPPRKKDTGMTKDIRSLVIVNALGIFFLISI
jgi:hypothetical protein